MWITDCIRLGGKANKVGFMVMGWFWGPKWGPFVPILEGKVDYWVYITHLDRNLRPIMEEIG